MVVSAERESECFLSFSWRVGKESEVTDDEYWGNHHERLRSDLVGREEGRGLVDRITVSTPRGS